MWKPAKAILLPTKEDTVLFIGNKRLHYNFSIEKRECISQHLYIINDDAKQDEWGYHKGSKEIVRTPKGGFPTGHCLKVVATTDKTLKLEFQHDSDGFLTILLPHPTIQFIQLFVEAVNKTDLVADGGLISLAVLVEYIDYCNKLTCHNALCEHGCIETDIKLKVSPKDNSINIKLPSKDSFTRQEYETGLREAFRAGNRRGYDQRSKMAGAEGLNEPDEDTWIAKNL